jgi:hypothetical protein
MIRNFFFNLTDCADIMNKSLFLVGEIGGNDYNYPLQSFMPYEMIQSFTLSVVDKISSTITVSHFLVLLFLLLPPLLLSQVKI